jgi:hypothetical protein
LERKRQPADAQLAAGRQCAACIGEQVFNWLETQGNTFPRRVGPWHLNCLGSRKSARSCLMAEQRTDKTEVRAMWIMVAVVVFNIVARMGWNMWTHPDWIHGN